jgi:hypothetical protein
MDKALLSLRMRAARDLAPNAKPAGFPVTEESCAPAGWLATAKLQFRRSPAAKLMETNRC